jgi:hypothetical protein
VSLFAWAGAAPRAIAQLPDPHQGPGGPILVITSSSTYGKYYAEILRTEGFNEFAVMDIGAVTDATLIAYDVAILAPASLNTPQADMFSNWVNSGGNLIAMQPDAKLASLLGLTSTSSTLSNGYLLVDTSTPAGNGIVGQPMQFHGTANLFTLNGASSLATLYTNPTTATPNPAVTLHNFGTNGGHAAAFSYDLATSVVYMRQGNPAWAAQERDGFTPIRPNDKFYGAATGDPQPDWVDLDNEVSISQADEQMRLLANLILQMNLAKKPLPRFWYFPRGKKAVVIMTGDDHGNGGTAGRFDQYLAASPPGCNVANWECIRSTSYIYEQLHNLTNAQAGTYTAQGFEVGLHLNTGCADFTPDSLDTYYSEQVSGFRSSYSSIPAPVTQRHHCIAWSDWVTAAKTQLKYGMRLDVSYYFWPPGWVQNRPGHFTGSAMPMRFADLDGTLIDVYNVPTQMTDESGQTYPLTSDALLSAAVGPQGYYGAYTVNAHTDTASNPVSDGVLSSALARGIPIVSSVQMLNWLDARNNSSFGGLAWSGDALSFTITPGSGATGLQAMVPLHSSAGVLTGIMGPIGPVTLTIDTIKGISYAFFSAAAGTYTATYATDTTPPTVASTAPVNGAVRVSQGTTVTATLSEAMDPATITTNSFVLRDPANAVVPATLTYAASTRIVTLRPSSSLAASTTYTVTLTSAIKDLSGNALANHTWSFTTAAGPSCPCSGWSGSMTPANPSVNDPNAVELGVKFKVDLDGFITGVRFYKGPTNTGIHIGNLWSSTGQLLATATFSNETASGWQQVVFSTPVAATAATVYVASYHTSVGYYAGDNNYFASSGVDNGPVHLLQDGVSGGNGAYAYSVSSTFPDSTYLSTNYWVDVVFTTNASPAPLTVTATTPASGATGVSTATAVSATFNNTINAETIGSSTFQLRDPSNTLIAASYSVSGNTATLTPSSYLVAGTTYTATLTTDVRDTGGSALAANSTWSFTTATTIPTGPEPAGWFAGDMHVHRSCGGSPEAVSSLYGKMGPENLAAISLLADMGNGEVLDPVTDLPLVNGQDGSVSTPGRIVHWDAEWHWDPTYGGYPHQALGGHVVALGLTEAHQIWEEYTYPIFAWARQQNGIAGFAHMQYLDGGIPQSLTCCTPIEYPVEVALGSADFISEDVEDNNSGFGMYSENFIQAYYKLLNTGFRPGFAAGTDYPCNGSRPLGSLLTYAQVAGGQMTYRNWIQGIKDGRTVISRNGHREFLNLTVNGSATPGDEIRLASATSLPVTVQWMATENLTGTIELVSNGVVVASTQESAAPGSPVNWSATVDFPKSGWVAARRMGSAGHYVHTAAVFVLINDAPIRASAADAQFFVQWMDNLLAKISPGGPWNQYFPTSLSQAQARYQSAKSIFQQIAAEAGGPACTSNCTIWPNTVVPGRIDDGPDNAVELGVKFRADVNGTVAGIRFYKASTNTGTHVGNLWSDTGQLLASATFSGETASGWQQVNFATPVAITANTVYVASYHTNAGHYSADQNDFAATGVDNPPLHALQNGISGFNGVYAYGSGSSFPTQGYNSSNYWVDVVFNAGTAPTLTSIAVTPANPSVQTGATQQFTATGTYSDSTTQNITSQVTWSSSDTAVATINSAGLATGVDTGTTTISAAQGSISGNTTLTVQPPPLAITTTLLPGGTVGVAYSATLSASGGTPPYTWSLASGSLPVGLTLDTTTGGLNGTPTVAGTSNFTVQVTDKATPPGAASKSLSIAIIALDTTPPTITAIVATPSSTTATITWTTNEPSDSRVDYGTNAATLSSTVTDGALVTAHTITLTGRAPGTTYYFRITSADAAANASTAPPLNDSPATFATTTAILTKVFADTAVPATIEDPDTGAVELGMKFRADVSGTVTGVRFYKGPNNAGPHVGHLWSRTGTLLATVTFSGETASGWQQATFPSPVNITAGQTYVISYHAPAGRYSVNSGYFQNSGLYNAPLYGLRNGVDGGNGVYRYGPAGAFPTSTSSTSNYWVDVVFSYAPGSAITVYPASAAIESGGGTLRGGAAAAMNADDNTFYQVNSTTTGTRTVSWYATFTGVPKNVNNLSVRYVGKESRSCTETLSVWNFQTAVWVQIDSRTVSTGEVLRANIPVPGLASDFVSGTSGTGDVRVRTRCSGPTANFYSSADLMSVSYQ